MEFLGDSVLGLVISDELYQRLPEASEGYLSRLRASLVNESVLAELSTELRLGELLNLGAGEVRSGGVNRKSILADALEALIASVYLDKGIKAATTFVLALYESRLKALPQEDELKDPKSRLQEHLQSKGLNIPEYRLVSATGDAHRQTFTAECKIASLNIITQGVSSSRRRAEQISAASAYQKVVSS
jgi:ribonuclease-3